MPTLRGQLNDATQLTSMQMLELAVKVMQDHLPLVFDSPCQRPEDVWRLLPVQPIYGVITAIQRPTSKTTNRRHYCVPSNLTLAEY